MGKKLSRRRFLQSSISAFGVGAGVWALGGVHGQEGTEKKKLGPNDRINIAMIGAGGRAADDLAAVAGENIVALCDVDESRAAQAYGRYPNVPKFTDFRVMLERQRDIDAVIVATPDHTHAVAAITAMKMGKHVYVEKPLTHDVWEARQMKLVAQQNHVATQMGNQHSSIDGLRAAVEIVRSGAIGEVREIHCWTNRPIWPQNLDRPNPMTPPPVPRTLNWDLWLGTAPQRPYDPAYLPFNWRGWWDFGTGAIGDMACHTANLAFRALNLTAPIAISADVEGRVNPETGPLGVTITYEFPAHGDLPACRLLWYERRRPPADLFHGQTVNQAGSLLIGSRGTLYAPGDYGTTHTLLPVEQFRDYRPPEPTFPRLGTRQTAHHLEWVAACKGGPTPFSNFIDHASQITESMLLGNVAIRVGQRIQWDTENLRITNIAEANRFIRREYREGWSLT